MNAFERIIKYFAMAFGIFLAITIISSIAQVGISILGVTTNSSSDKKIDFTKKFDSISNIKIENPAGKLIIKKGEEFKVTGSNIKDDLIVKDTNGTLQIKGNHSFPMFHFDNKINSSEIVITIPEDFVANTVDIDCGFGNVTIEDLSASRLDIEAGAGNVTASNIESEHVDIDGGAGNIYLNDVHFQNVKLDSGVGNVTIEGEFLGDNKIDCGVGNINLSLKGNNDMYRSLIADNGIGNIRVNGKKYSDIEWNNSTGDGSLKIDGGLGNIDIDFE